MTDGIFCFDEKKTTVIDISLPRFLQEIQLCGPNHVYEVSSGFSNKWILLS